ncbi:type II toxin-antitoxin system Phd/YefM family antitoxin (plasmid) [Nocardia sp. NBC_01377]|uniref:hypothetical protein n=1 Tax=Nocardia sp. NBC_01377 TaxID=2903595 RepID=UPI00324430D0
MRVIEFDYLRAHLSDELRKAYRDDEVTVIAYRDRPIAVLMSHGVWSVGRQANQIPPTLVDEPINSRAARPMLRELRERLDRGRHVTVTVYKDQAVIAPYEWAREAFADLPAFLQLPAVEARGEGSVQIVYRSARMLQKLRAEFEGSEDPEWEMDRRLSAMRSHIPADRRKELRGVVYVESGRVARVRALDPDAEWIDLDERISLAPVSPPLNRKDIDARLPGLGLYPGDQRLAPQGASREYLAF